MVVMSEVKFNVMLDMFLCGFLNYGRKVKVVLKEGFFVYNIQNYMSF